MTTGIRLLVLVLIFLSHAANAESAAAKKIREWSNAKLVAIVDDGKISKRILPLKGGTNFKQYETAILNHRGHSLLVIREWNYLKQSWLELPIKNNKVKLKVDDGMQEVSLFDVIDLLQFPDEVPESLK